MLACYFTLVAFLASLISTPAFGQGVVTSDGDIVGTVRVGATCTSGSRTCIWVKNDSQAHPMEVISVSYLSPNGQVFIESPPVIDGRLQCVFPGDRPCAPVLTPGEQGAMKLPGPPSPGQLITVRLCLWATPGGDLTETVRNMGSAEVILIGDLAASGQAPSEVVEERVARIGTSSWLADWAKGTKY